MKRFTFKGIPVAQDEELYNITPCDVAQTGNYYFLSNDLFSYHYSKKLIDDGVIIGVANPHFFHVISLVSRKARLRRIIAVDFNAEQLKHFKLLYDLILFSCNRIDFLQRLFKVTFNAEAIRLLQELQPCQENIVSGGVDKDPYHSLERKIWDNLEFDEKLFRGTFGLDATAEDIGLKIKANTVGDINTYYATILCCSRSDYEHWPFTIGFGTGFLNNEDTFLDLQTVLRNTQIYMLNADLATIYSDLVLSNRYHPQFIWTSNLLCDYFVEKHPKLKEIIDVSIRMGTQSDPQLPEVDMILLQDERNESDLPQMIDNRKDHKREWSVHTRNFSKVCHYLQGVRNLEVIAVQNWFEQDNGVSKLPNTEYMLLDDFLTNEDPGQFDTIFLHILVGHGVSKTTFTQALYKARTLSRNLIILEHNRDSRDFRKQGLGVTVDEVRDVLGCESFLDFGPGVRCGDRNILLVYRQ